jgi:hypothetical protein
MARRVIIMSYRWILAALVIAAIVVQLMHTLHATPAGSAANFFSFFTIESNLIAAAVFVIGAVPGRLPNARWYDHVRGAAATYMSVTGAVYATLLSDLPAAVDSTIPWVNEVLHYLMPLAVFLDWVFVPPRRRIKFTHALLWAVYPLAYAAYSLIRGAVAHWYPYPFLNVDMHGYGGVMLNVLGIAIGALLAISAIVWLGNAMQSGRRVPDGSADKDASADDDAPADEGGRAVESSGAEPLDAGSMPGQRAMNEATVIMPLVTASDDGPATGTPISAPTAFA